MCNNKVYLSDELDQDFEVVTVREAYGTGASE